MEFKFDPNQEFQVKAIEAVVDLFDGQPRLGPAMHFAAGPLFGVSAIPNRLDLDERALLANLGEVQTRNGIRPDAALQCIEQGIETLTGPKTARFPNFSVEMETGTGKTYVYLRTILELNKRYGMLKFIIVVPSVAIREGVQKTLQITKKHLNALYGNPVYRPNVYDSSNLSQVRQFAQTSSVEILVMTIDSFNKASNVIRQSTDRLQGETPIHLIQAARPILILDEPQNMESEKSITALAALDPLFALRYSATHRVPYNIVYRLSPADAYRQGLVKKIEVDSVITEGQENLPYLVLEDIQARKTRLTARLRVRRLTKKGTVAQARITVKPGDSLQAKTNRAEYAPFVVDEINRGAGFVRFANNIELTGRRSRLAPNPAAIGTATAAIISPSAQNCPPKKPTGPSPSTGEGWGEGELASRLCATAGLARPCFCPPPSPPPHAPRRLSPTSAGPLIVDASHGKRVIYPPFATVGGRVLVPVNSILARFGAKGHDRR